MVIIAALYCLFFTFRLECSEVVPKIDHRGERFISTEWQNRKHYFYTYSMLHDENMEEDALYFDDIVFVKKNIDPALNFRKDMRCVRSVTMAKILINNGAIISNTTCRNCSNNPQCTQNVFFGPGIWSSPQLILFFWRNGADTQKTSHGYTPITHLLQETINSGLNLTMHTREIVRTLIAVGVPTETDDAEKTCAHILKNREDESSLLMRACIAQAKNEVADAHGSLKETIQENIANKGIVSIIAGYVGHQCPDFVYEELEKM